ncbi:DivIVA domain-containing protein [Micromonospora endophytica]|uniref:Cell division protein DivIVA n=1 Tax=Micromonospora endophytica TaxID=515350 RepID=A0A2W2CVY1_9ACTN|nr:DivIVA domain-containing protein [Micromonospora endophytica]PZF97464.1 cell division protein DivIVA [Micromonospora endophytica]RIW41374.1 DivIVA domain-containing protein [Micromonospora endophytica]BCJ58330.1 hypothetical protein Jiend_17520 [Micromonospora endophytica]
MIYVSREHLRPRNVRAVVFDTRWRGLDPAQVHGYLDLVADELDRLQRELVTAHTEAERIRQALRQWQSRQARGGYGRSGAPNNRWSR